MSTAVAMGPSPAPHDRPSFGSDVPPANSTSPTAQRTAAGPPPASSAASPSSALQSAPAPRPRSGSGSPRGAGAAASTHRSSPPSASRNTGGPKIIVKKEPGGSPPPPTSRHRPRKLDLSKNTTNIISPATGRPLTARESLGIQEVGIACLSPGFVPKDAQEQEQLNRSMSVREHQRQIIEARLQQQSAKLDNPDKEKEGSHFAAKTPGLARKRGAPPGLSIVAPSHEQFANERVIQSAPLGQTFTGRHNPLPLTRHITNQPSNLGNTSHIHHVPANQTNNRLPPIADVFGQNLSGHPDSSGHALFANQGRPLPSPHQPPPQQQQAPHSARPREYKSAEEAQAELAGGRPELLPKLVRYGGGGGGGTHQPPTPPSPPQQQQQQQQRDPRDPHPHPHQQNHHHHHHNHNHNHNHHHPHAPASTTRPAAAADPASARRLSNNHSQHGAPAPHNMGPAPGSSASMKRRRAEYEEGGSPPLGNGGRPAPAFPPPSFSAAVPSSGGGGGSYGARRGPFGEGRDSPETQEAKKEEFLSLCARAWDLFHS
ncbi:hypothetical protein VTI74DRAFT_3319 [Chaetomium olivicolor]